MFLNFIINIISKHNNEVKLTVLFLLYVLVLATIWEEANC